jgi:hypothetical protein
MTSVEPSEPSKSPEIPAVPKTVEPMTPYYFDAVKILGTGNSTGLFGALRLLLLRQSRT